GRARRARRRFPRQRIRRRARRPRPMRDRWRRRARCPLGRSRRRPRRRYSGALAARARDSLAPAPPVRRRARAPSAAIPPGTPLISNLAPMESTYKQLKQRLAEIVDLRVVAGLASWDQHVMMPPGGAAARAEQLATLRKVAHERFVSDEIGRLLDALRPYEEQLPYDSDEAALIRITRRDSEKQRRVPTELSAEITRAGAVAYQAWVQARQDSDFAAFLPYLRRNVELKHRYVECFEPTDELYDVLLDDFEPGMKTAEARAVLDDL